MSILSEEEWRDIPGYGRYQASSLGRIRSNGIGGNGKPGVVLKTTPQGPQRRQYPYAQLSIGGKKRSRFVHVLVALAFHGPAPSGHEVDHLDNDPMNPCPENLEYVTRSEQQKRAIHRDGRRLADRAGEKNAMAILKASDVLAIRESLSGGERQSSIARRYGVCRQTVHNIYIGRSWKVS
jgi:hypothetical protein